MPRHPFITAVCAAALLAAGCENAPPGAKPVQTIGTATLGEAYGDAELVAQGNKGRQAAQGKGDSMAPVYGDATLLVINPIAYEDLRPGMTVAYLNSRGLRVVHKLVTRTRDGWIVVGLNNDRIDTDLVTPKNLLGVHYATLLHGGESTAP